MATPVAAEAEVAMAVAAVGLARLVAAEAAVPVEGAGAARAAERGSGVPHARG